MSARLQFNEMTGAGQVLPDSRAIMASASQPAWIWPAKRPASSTTPNAPDWSPLTLDTNAYGQSIAVTPLQLVRMAAAVGNDGKLMRPYIVQKRCHGDYCVTTQPQQDGQPIEPEVAATVRRMLVISANHYARPRWQRQHVA